jgi:hypothetical protein
MNLKGKEDTAQELDHHRVASSCEMIYDMNYAADSSVVENLLQVDSLVPIAVHDC